MSALNLGVKRHHWAGLVSFAARHQGHQRQRCWEAGLRLSRSDGRKQLQWPLNLNGLGLEARTPCQALKIETPRACAAPEERLNLSRNPLANLRTGRGSSTAGWSWSVGLTFASPPEDPNKRGDQPRFHLREAPWRQPRLEIAGQISARARNPDQARSPCVSAARFLADWRPVADAAAGLSFSFNSGRSRTAPRWTSCGPPQPR